MRWCGLAVCAALAAACGDGGGGGASDARPSLDGASPIDGGGPDAYSDPICGMSNSGAGTAADCAAFCAPLDGLECASGVRLSTCQAWCEALKVECTARFDFFVDCASPVPDWACIGTTLIAGSCTVALDCPCINPLLQGCAGDVAGIETPGAGERAFAAAHADCVGLTSPDPDSCATAAGTTGMTVDLSTEVGGDDQEVAVFLAFALDDSFTADQVQSVTLELASGGFGGESDDSGEVWLVEPFTRDDLFTAAPARVGTAPIASSLGPVGSCEVTSWTLDLAPEPSTTVYLGLYPLSSNGTDYFGLGGEFEPRLRIALTP